MSRRGKELSHAEIWDDSALVDSWNDAYEEYKYYHSIHARGEKVQDVLDAFERGEDDANKVTRSDVGQATIADDAALSSEEGEVNEDEDMDDAQHPAEPDSTSHDPAKAKVTRTSPSAVTLPRVETSPEQDDLPMAQAMLDKASQDPALKSLMMSWYWAGYYTGFYEGQRQASSQRAPAAEGKAGDA